ncbi:hypothetical protein K443DRAFT_455528 [Laccaria amethystina LaAM-08-1]|uniref:Uncharacterized protein n=1 Tax=Laccaria amethystina LaAM-08-1 TaxID=1095629 RepID=A0A0C9YN09_9AGAR|nr:hypothetical protein K443DRAFT_455528 [Laccaria amethystina LaAM-08-1]
MQTSSVIFFYPFLLLISPSVVGFGALIQQSAFGNTSMSTHPVFGNIGSCPCALATTTVSPASTNIRFTCFAFDLPACLRYPDLCITMLCIIKTWGTSFLRIA